MTLYDVGRVAVLKNSTKVLGTNTEWLINDVKANDLIILSGKIYEISSINSSTELILTEAYTGEALDNSEYVIIHIAEQVFAADIAKKIQELVENYKARENEIPAKLEEHEKFINLWKTLGLYIDEDGDLAQDTSQSGSILSSDIPVASSQDVQELLDELGINGH